MPVICDSCGTRFAQSNIFGGSGIVTLKDVGVGPCPSCGGMGRVPDGTYQFNDDTIRLLQGPQRTKNELARFADILRGILGNDATLDDGVATVRHEIPDLAPLVEEIRKTRNADWQKFWLRAILSVVLTLLASQSIQAKNIDFNAAINQTVEQHNYYSQQVQPRMEQTPTNLPRQVHKVGRNEPCPCGSEKKYKKCHGDPAREQRTSSTR